MQRYNRQSDETGGAGYGDAAERAQGPALLQELDEWQSLVDSGNLPPVDVLCSWTDLSGVGHCLRKAKWDLGEAQDLGLIRNVAHLYRRLADRAYAVGMQERILVLNDGVARAVDVALGADLVGQVLHLRGLMHAHLMLLSDLDPGFSVRTVLAGGQRVQYAETTESTPTPPADRLEEEPEEYRRRLEIVYNPRAFQMNTAFSRAYILEREAHLPAGGFHIAGEWIGTFEGLFPGCLSKVQMKTGLLLKFAHLGEQLLDVECTRPRSCRCRGLEARVVSVRRWRAYRGLDGDSGEWSLPIARVARGCRLVRKVGRDRFRLVCGHRPVRLWSGHEIGMPAVSAEVIQAARRDSRLRNAVSVMRYH